MVERSKLNILSLYKEKQRPLILDGAIGSLLQQRGFQMDEILWSSAANLYEPEMVVQLHQDYINSGTEIITTNTFRTNPTFYELANLKMSNEEFVNQGVQLAIRARENQKIIIAGSNAPAEDCYQAERTISKSELERNHKKHIDYLWSAGCDVIWNETQSHRDEIEIICKCCSENSIPYVVNLYFDKTLKLLSGEQLEDIVDFVGSYSPLAIGFNCIKPELVYMYMESNRLPQPFGFYFNCGAGEVSDKNIKCGIDPKDYLEEIKPLLEYNPLFVGSCCGSNPNHTKVIKEYFDKVYGS